MKQNIMLAVFIMSFCLTSVLGQKADETSPKSKKSASNSSNTRNTPKEQLKSAIDKSQQEKNISIKVEIEVQNKKFVSIFEHSAPNRYYLLETKDGVNIKEAVEIAGQRFQKKDEQWVKTRKDYFPLREQIGLYFPAKFVSKRDDAIKVKDVKVINLGETIVDDEKCFKYSYEVSYKDWNETDSGIAWVNSQTGLLKKLETGNHGLFGVAITVRNYFYDKEVKIEQPKNYIERDWID